MRRYVVLAALLASSACALRRPPVEALKAKTVDLYQGMSAPEVMKLLGEPDEREGDMCGELLRKPWKCITWTYRTRSPYQTLRVRFQGQSEAGEGPMVVNSWDF